eukprot:2557483-Rhodomonas_salina.1
MPIAAQTLRLATLDSSWSVHADRSSNSGNARLVNTCRSSDRSSNTATLDSSWLIHADRSSNIGNARWDKLARNLNPSNARSLW